MLGEAEELFHDRRAKEFRIDIASAAIGSEIDQGLGKIRLASDVCLDSDTIRIKEP